MKYESQARKARATKIETLVYDRVKRNTNTVQIFFGSIFGDRDAHFGSQKFACATKRRGNNAPIHWRIVRKKNNQCPRRRGEATSGGWSFNMCVNPKRTQIPEAVNKKLRWEVLPETNYGT